MEVEFTPDVQARLEQLATETGRAQGEFVLDAMAGFFRELDQVRGILDGRYDEIKSGAVELLDGADAFARLRARSAARRLGQ